jgi:hypothetical protein
MVETVTSFLQRMMSLIFLSCFSFLNPMGKPTRNFFGLEAFDIFVYGEIWL